MRRWLLLLVMVHTVGAAAPAPAPLADWRVWALRMDKAQRSLNYDATMVIDAGSGDWDLVELSQRVGPGGAEQQWVSLNGTGRRQVRTAQGLSILGPEGDQRIGHGPQLRAGPLLEQLEQHYAVAVAPRERIAGRQALKLSLQPVTPDRYGLRLWIDVDTGLPLRSERLGSGGQLLERRMVTRLVVHGFAGKLDPQPAASISDSGWKLPDGFRLVGSALAVPGIAGARHWVISDGVAWVSIYQMQLPQGQIIESNGWRHGALSQVTLRQGDDWFYLLGDLPPETLVSVGEAALAGAR